MIENLKKQLECNDVKYEDLTFNLYGLFSGDVYERIWIDLPDVWDFNYDSLLQGKMAEGLEMVAPYLVELSFESRYLDEILESYGKNGCVFFCSPLEFDEALARMREVFIVHDENGAEGYLRFYSPNIFRMLIDKHNLEHLQRMFKQIMYYYCEAENDSMTLNRYRYDGNSLQIEPLLLEEKKNEDEV